VTQATPATPPDLPTDAEALRALVLAMMAERDAAVAERDQLRAEHHALLTRNERLEHLLRTLRRLQFGRKSERLPEAQLQLGLEDTETAIAKIEVEAERSDPALRDVIPAQFRVLVTRRPKLACRACAGVVVQQPAPPRLIEGGIPTEATVAHVLVARYADHLPLYRQAQIWTRQGLTFDRSTLASWVGTPAAEIAPVVGRLKEIMLALERLFADETVVPVLDPGRGKTKQGYFWAIARDDRPWGGKDPPAVIYSYAPGRGQAHARALLGGYRGILQCDGYAPYKQLDSSKNLAPVTADLIPSSCG
jgi:transposase